MECLLSSLEEGGTWYAFSLSVSHVFPAVRLFLPPSPGGEDRLCLQTSGFIPDNFQGASGPTYSPTVDPKCCFPRGPTCPATLSLAQGSVKLSTIRARKMGPHMQRKTTEAEFCSRSLGMVVKDAERQSGQIKRDSIVQGARLWCLSFLVVTLFLLNYASSKGSILSSSREFCSWGLKKPQLVFARKEATLHTHRQMYSISVIFKCHGESNDHEDA